MPTPGYRLPLQNVVNFRAASAQFTKFRAESRRSFRRPCMCFERMKLDVHKEWRGRVVGNGEMPPNGCNPV